LQADTVRKACGIDVESSTVYQAFLRSVAEGGNQFSEAPYDRMRALITPVVTRLMSPGHQQPATSPSAVRYGLLCRACCATGRS